MARKAMNPKVPPELAKEKGNVRLFLTYLRQSSTQDALLAAARGSPQLRELTNCLHTLKVQVGDAGRGDSDLRELISVAPAFELVAALSYKVRRSVLPVIPSEACVVAVMRAYHNWVRRQAGL